MQLRTLFSLSTFSTALLLATAAQASALVKPEKPPASGHSAVYDYSHQETWQAAHDQSQSPIDIDTATAVEAADGESDAIVLDHTRGTIDAVGDNGHSVQVESHITDAMIRGRHFKLAQFHFHAESEHTVNGKHFPLEGHFVFKAQDGRLAVIGVMYAEGEANPVVQEVLNDLKPGLGEVKPAQHDIDIEGLIPKSHAYYHYLGSLTTPPLTENVEWYVMNSPLTMSKAQIDAFVSHYRHNNRNIQSLNGRPLIHFGG